MVLPSKYEDQKYPEWKILMIMPQCKMIKGKDKMLTKCFHTLIGWDKYSSCAVSFSELRSSE